MGTKRGGRRWWVACSKAWANAIKRASEMLEAGEAREMVVSTEKMMTLIRIVNETYFLTLTMSPDGNFGKGRYLMRTTIPKLIAEL